MILWPAILFVVALFLSLLITPVVARLAMRMRLVDLPDSRKLHRAPIPRIGGLAVAACFYLTMGILVWNPQAPAGLATLGLLKACLVPSLIVLALGTIDDVRSVKPIYKVIVEVICAAWICWNGIRIDTLSIPLGGTSLLGHLSVPLTICWILLITNAINIVDGMDGLASGVAFIAVTCLFVASTQRGNPVIPLLAAPLAGALLGFLRFNFNPARVFLGDSGSLWTGFMLAVASIVGFQKSSVAIAVASPLLTLALPLLEVSTSIARRFLSGHRIWTPDSSHIHHQLLRRGLNMKQAAIVLYAGSALFGGASLFLAQASDSAVGLTTLALAGVAWLGLQQLGYAEFVEIRHAFRRGFLYQRRIIQNNILTRRLAAELAQAAEAGAAWDALIRVATAQSIERLELIRTFDTLSPDGSVIDEERKREREWDSPAGDRGGLGAVVAVHLFSKDVKVGEIVITLSADEPVASATLGLLITAVSDRGAVLLQTEPPPVTRGSGDRPSVAHLTAQPKLP